MRIMHVLNHTHLNNGHVHAAVDLACMQAKFGHSVFLCSGGGDFDHLLRTSNVTHIKVNQERRLAVLARALASLREAIIFYKPDIVHAHMMTAAGLIWILRKFMTFGFVTTVHNSFQRSSIIMGLGNRVIAVSNAVGLSMARRGVSRSKIRIVLNGTIGSPRYGPKPLAKPLSRVSITFVGGLNPRKGINELLLAFKIVCSRVPAATLYIVGGKGDSEVNYKKMASEIGCGHLVHFCGPISDPRPYLLGTDIFVLASHADPAPLVIAEAREAGCAIIATDVDGIPEMLEYGRAGLLVPPKRPDLLADALVSVVSDNALLGDLRMRSQLNIGKLSLSRVTQETIGVYAEIVDRRPPMPEVLLQLNNRV
jgi:glycosyltransferase involved in cell wall biosynthesis